MMQSVYRAGLFAALFGLLLVPGLAVAQKGRARLVVDDAGLFSEGAIAKADAVIKGVKQKHGKDIAIDTVEKGPDKNAEKWAQKRFDNMGIDGVYVVITNSPKHFDIIVGDQTRQKGYFTLANRTELKEILLTNLKKKGANKDDALLAIVDYMRDTMNRQAPVAANPPVRKQRAEQAPAVAPVPVQHREENTMPPWVGWVCAIIAVLFVVWIIFAIIRSITGMMGGGYGGGYGGGGGYGYGGGGGFLTGMLGGMFGSMAGMWMYNNMFGGHATYGSNGNVNWGGGDQGSAASGYQADTSGSADGADWGDDDKGGGGKGDDGDKAGGDWGGGGGGKGDDAGGGDWGGGGDAGGSDAGGGGDWGGGGGGGDAGGGGDWGGGGGGGGGDWGGGGGGGDFGGGGGGGGGDW